MLNLICTAVISFLLSSNAKAAEESIKDFAKNLETLFSIEASKTLAVGKLTHFARQLNTNSTAEASYNPFFNTIFLKDENLISTGTFSYNVKSITMLKKEDPAIYPVKISTIFHELGHSEMDQFILNGITSDDKMMLRLYENEFIPWTRRNYPGINPKTLFQEIYGYYRGNVIETLFADKATIEILNGLNVYQHKCFPSIYLKKVVHELSRAEFSQFLFPENDPSWEAKYRNRFFPNDVFIKGQDIDLAKNANDPFMMYLNKAFWYYFSTNYHPPSNTKELAIHFRSHHEDREFLKECRNKIWDQLH